MLALGAEHAGRLFTMMHEDEIRLLSSTMAQLGVVPSDTVESLCGDSVDNFGASGGILGSFQNTEISSSERIAEGPRRADHGGNSGSCRTHDVG